MLALGRFDPGQNRLSPDSAVGSLDSTQDAGTHLSKISRPYHRGYALQIVLRTVHGLLRLGPTRPTAESGLSELSKNLPPRPPELLPRTKPQVHQAVLKTLSFLPRGSKILDAPCGEGALLVHLKEIGFLPYGLDLDHRAFGNKNIACLCWDLNKTPFPFEDKFFDCVTCVEGIEHLENPFALVGEFSRLLKPGGWLILTTPNIVSLRSRVRFLGSGFFHMFNLPLNEAKPDPSHHITPLTLTNLGYILSRRGFEIEKVACSYMKPASFLYLVLAPWMALYTFLAFRREHDPSQRQRNWQTLKRLFSPTVLLGEHLVILARTRSPLALP